MLSAELASLYSGLNELNPGQITNFVFVPQEEKNIEFLIYFFFFNLEYWLVVY